MRHLRKFDTQTNYNNVKSSLALPNMCLLNDIYDIASEGDEDIVPIEYLKGASGTRIDTGIPGSDSIKIEIKYNISAHEQYGAVFGNYIDENTNCFRLICQSSSSNNGYINVNTKAGSSAALPNGVAKNKDIIAVVSKTNITIDGTSITPPTTNGNNNTTNIALFSKSTTFSPPGTMGLKICYCKMWNNNVLVRDFIPVRVSNVGYMFDCVSKKLFGNSGTGNFTLGQDIVPIEYLQSSGTQYINTNIIPDANTGIMLTIMRLNNTDSYICGVRNDSGNTRWVLGCPNYSGYGSVITSSSYPAINIKYDVGLNYLNNKKFTIPLNNVATNLPTLPFTPTTDIRLFGSSGVNANYTKWSGKIYACKISQNNIIVRDFIPVKLNNVGYMYDKVSRQLFGNVGSGSFTCGPIDSKRKLTRTK